LYYFFWKIPQHPEFYMPMFWNTVYSICIGSASRKNNQDEIVGVFLWGRFWLKNCQSQSERWGGDVACPRREIGCGEQRLPKWRPVIHM
jgi:hypothetical protein